MTLEEYRDKCNDYSIWYSHLPEPTNEEEFKIINQRFIDQFGRRLESYKKIPENKESFKNRVKEISDLTGVSMHKATSIEFKLCLERNEAMIANHRHCKKFGYDHSYLY